MTDAQTLAAGAFHTCARTTTDTLKCWGDNSHGQLGDGSLLGSPLPVELQDSDETDAVAAGFEHSCRLHDYIECWGRNDGGQLGDATLVDRLVFAHTIGSDDAFLVAAGWHHTCFLQDLPGSAYIAKCTGVNAAGQLGDHSATTRNIPVTVIGYGDAIFNNGFD